MTEESHIPPMRERGRGEEKKGERAGGRESSPQSKEEQQSVY